MIKFDVLNRFTGAVQFTAEIDCADDAPTSIKLGLAVKWAFKARANLAGANLAGANLADANLADANLARAYLADANLARAYLARAYLARAYLAGADLAGANLAWLQFIDGGLRSDGYRFLLSNFNGEGLRIKAGCRSFDSFEAARGHWKRTRGGTALGDETFAILDHLERMAYGRKILPLKVETKDAA